MQDIINIIESTFDRIINAVYDRVVADPFGIPFIETPDDRLYLPYIVSFVVICFGLFLFRDRFRVSAGDEHTNFFKYLFPRSVYTHRSAIADFKFYAVNRVFGFIFLASLAGFALYVSGLVNQFFQTIFGPSLPGWGEENIGLFRLLYFITLFLVADLSFYAYHFLHHKVMFFWEFHKVHHSAEVLTPITNYRNHPIEKFFLVLIGGLPTGTVIGAFGYVFGRDIGSPDFLALTLFNTTVTGFLFAQFSNLRHSHIWLSYGPVLEHIFISPAQHQIHHSYEDRHLDKNFGLQLAIWDWMFGTLYVPQGREEFRLGLHDREHEQYHSVLALYFLPLLKAGRVLMGYASRGQAACTRLLAKN